MTKISVTVDAETLERIKTFLPAKHNLSAVLNDALREQLARYEALAALDEMDREHPISESGRIAGEQLWRAIELSSTPAPSLRSRKVTKRSASRRARR